MEDNSLTGFSRRQDRRTAAGKEAGGGEEPTRSSDRVTCPVPGGRSSAPAPRAVTPGDTRAALVTQAPFRQLNKEDGHPGTGRPGGWPDVRLFVGVRPRTPSSPPGPRAGQSPSPEPLAGALLRSPSLSHREAVGGSLPGRPSRLKDPPASSASRAPRRLPMEGMGRLRRTDAACHCHPPNTGRSQGRGEREFPPSPVAGSFGAPGHLLFPRPVQAARQPFCSRVPGVSSGGSPLW